MKTINKEMKSNGGYTLLEMLLVLTLLAGAAFYLLLQVPNDYRRSNIEAAASVLLEDLRATQQAAIAESVWHQVEFAVYDNEYRVYRQGKLIRLTRLPEGVCFGNKPEPSKITFLPSGTSSAGTTVLLKAGDLERSVVIAPVMGRIRLGNAGGPK